MTGVFIDALHGWQNFYFMGGGAAAGLLGLMFVAMSLGMHLVNVTTKDNIKTFVKPSIFYFVSVILIACVMLIPVDTSLVLAGLLFAGGIGGAGMIAPQVKRLIEVAIIHKDFLLSDWLAQVIAPVASYGLILIAAGCFAANQWSLAFAELWVSTVLLLVCGIANTWALVVWIIEQQQR